MKNSGPFRFKHFSVAQDRTAMKVGTDGVLLGAWAGISHKPETILDIGTGTGLIALMLAQRSEAELIDALEPEPGAFEQAVENFEHSDWGDRLFCYHATLQEFTEEIDDTYDLIVSNPPFYNGTYKASDSQRTLARHTESLNYVTLLSATVKLLAENGRCAFILPFNEEAGFLKIAETHHLFPSRITRVKGHNEAPVKRSLIELRFQKTNDIDHEILILETERNKRTPAYRRLVFDFYLKP